MANAYELAKPYLGQYLDYDGAYGSQCVDIVQAVSAKLGFRLMGNGNQIGTIGNVTAFADVIPYREGMELRTGDIISQNASGHNYGHAVIFGSGTYDNALVIEQNFDSGPVIEHRRSLRYTPALRVVRFRNQTDYKPDGNGGGGTGDENKPKTQVNSENRLPSDGELWEVKADIAEAVDNVGSTKIVDTFYKCNKVVGKVNGSYVAYKRYDGSTAYLKLDDLKQVDSRDDDITRRRADIIAINEYNMMTSTDGLVLDSEEISRIVSLGDLIKQRVVSYNGYDWGYLFQNNLPNNGEDIIGEQLNAYGFLTDSDGYLILAYPEDYGDIRGATFATPFGYIGKAYYPNNDITEFRVYVK